MNKSDFLLEKCGIINPETRHLSIYIKKLETKKTATVEPRKSIEDELRENFPELTEEDIEMIMQTT